MIGMREDDIHQIWDALSDFDRSRTEAAANWLMALLTERTGLANATWAGAIRMNGGADGDPLRGWRVATVTSLHPAPLQADADLMAGILDVWDRREIDPSFLLPLREVGQFRTYSLRRELPAHWFETPFYHRHYGAFGIHDVVFVAFPLNADCESHFGFYSNGPIADDVIAALTYALRGLKWFHRHLMLSHGLLLASAPLVPVEQTVLQSLLGDMSEKRIAQQLGLSGAATHRHVAAIFRKFGVRSRAGLMRLWLNCPVELWQDGAPPKGQA